ncbi:MAG TPA: hypothetical protein VFR84_05025 [Candidatus Angelobacter sp.]|nr:hypothetical protein [Candidatus Angelobacter sp.]
MLQTGIAALDRLTGGIPRRGLTQICAPPQISSGRTTLLLSLMAQVTRAEEFCALVDASDCFDPASAGAAGVDMSRLLWVRCQRMRGIKPLEQAFRAADIVVQNGGFGLIAVDLGNIDERWVRKTPLSTWFRFARVIEKMPAALVFLLSYPAALPQHAQNRRALPSQIAQKRRNPGALELGAPALPQHAQNRRALGAPAQSCAALTLQLAGSRGRWQENANLFSGVECEFAIGRARTRKPVQSAHGCFTANPVWA